MVAVLLGLNPGWAGQCQGRIGPQTNITGKTAYDPFSAADVLDDYRMTVTNTGAATCTYGLLFRSKTNRPRLGETLAYDIIHMGQSSLLTAVPAAKAPVARLKTPLEPGTAVQIDYQMIIPRGQFAAPGQYRDVLDLELYALDDHGRAVGDALQATTLAVSYTVERVLSVSIKGGEMATTVGFGTLIEGAQRSVEIQARGNQSFQLQVSSDHGGALALTPKLRSQDWSVPYSATLGGVPLNLAAATRVRDLPPKRPESEASYPLIVTIGNVGQKPAGRYEDVITIEIKGAVP